MLTNILWYNKMKQLIILYAIIFTLALTLGACLNHISILNEQLNTQKDITKAYSEMLDICEETLGFFTGDEK